MARIFDAYVMVDWSASSKPTTGEDSIWVGTMRRDVRFQLAYSDANPDTRAKAEALIRKEVEEVVRKGGRVLVGVDFPLGYPRGTAQALKLDPAQAPWAAMHAFIGKEIRDKADNTNNRFQVAAMMNRRISEGPFPFWGCPPKDALTTLQPKKGRPHGPEDVPELRACEQVAKGAQPVWKLYTSGNVGSQALVGIPVVKRLREAFGARARVWPFETGWQTLTSQGLDGVDVVFAEIYPSLLEVRANPGEIKDQAQIRTIAEFVARADDAGKLEAMFGPSKALAPDLIKPEVVSAVEREEGWILGAV